jgi:hypothetical protein
VCVEHVSAMCTAGMPRSKSVALEGRLVGCLYKLDIPIAIGWNIGILLEVPTSAKNSTFYTIGLRLMLILARSIIRHTASNGNASETKANESFDNGVFLLYRSEANTFDNKQIIFEAKRTHSIEQKLFSKRSEHVR